MTEDLQKKLAEDFPEFFRELGGDPRVTCMAWGVPVGDGWHGIIRRACRELSAIDDLDFRFTQIKEKFGTLRLYYSASSADNDDAAMDVALVIKITESASWFVCEACGTTEGVTTEGGYLQTLCTPCRKK